jgi:hypothetical protein
MTRPSVKGRLSLVPTCGGSAFFFFFPFPSASVTQTKGKAAAAAATTSFIMRGRYSWRRMTTTWLLIAPPPSRIHSVTSRNGIDPSISTRPGSYPITLAVSPRGKKARGILLSRALGRKMEAGSDIIYSIRPASIECPLHNGQRRRNALATSPLALVPVIPDMLIIVVVDIVDTEET